MSHPKAGSLTLTDLSVALGSARTASPSYPRRCEMEQIISLIGNVGFPIAISIYLIFTNNEQDKRHREEVDALRTAIEQNTLALQKMCDKEG